MKMKKTAAFLCTMLAAACSEADLSPSAQLAARLQAAVAEGKIFYGHQDDLSYGHAWLVTDWENDALERSDVHDVSGKYPAVLGFDLGGIETGRDVNLDRVPFGLIRKAARVHAERGGIVTFSWHLRNPLTGGDSWDISSKETVRSILEGGSRHEIFLSWLDRAADFMASLGDLPVIFRPWHENIGSWFWWGGDLCSEEEYKALFRLTHDYFTKQRGLKNILWCYSPNGPVSARSYLSRYPGDEYVDLLGTDMYEYPGDGTLEEAGERFGAEVRQMLSVLTDLARKHDKLMCFSETGLEGLGDADWWCGVLYPAIRPYPVSYVLTWRNAHDNPGHFYAPWKGFENEADFVRFSEKEEIVLL